MLGMLSMLQPLLVGVAATFRRLSLQLLHLHKAVAKLGYIVTSLLSGVMQEGYCTASETDDTEAGKSSLVTPLSGKPYISVLSGACFFVICVLLGVVLVGAFFLQASAPHTRCAYRAWG